MKRFLVIVAALAMITSSAYAADWNFYGSARVTTFVTDTNKANNVSDTTTFDESLQSNARIGANVKVSDELSGRFEYGTSDGNANVRLLYGVWNFGAGSLTVGQDYTPLMMPVSNQVYSGDNSLCGWGGDNTNRLAQLKLRFGDFQVALVEANTTTANAIGSAAIANDSTFSTEVKYPALMAKYRYAGDNWFASVAGGYQTFDAGSQSVGVDSTMVEASTGVTFGAASIKGSVYAGTNVGNFAETDVNGLYDSSATNPLIDGQGYAVVNSDGALTDTKGFGYALAAAYTINDMVGVEAGFGYASSKYNDGSKDDVMSYYLQAPITMAPGVFVVPEIGVVDYMQSVENTVQYIGAKWQINF
ncbi:MAG: porin [Desulfobacteraceae bacterium]|nr:porin [Desulfobacteraceae bacterium]